MSSNTQAEQASADASVVKDSSEPQSQIDAESKTDTETSKPRKRDFFKFSKKDDSKNKSKSTADSQTTIPPPITVGGLRSPSPLSGAAGVRSAASPPRSHPYGSPVSPGRQLRSASPRAHSPASSMIFERNVQEDAPAQASPQIPTHITVENHIPPALDATSEAITDKRLDPDTVEIVTHAQHQPAAASLSGVLQDQSLTSSTHEDMPTSHFSRHDADNVSNYGSLETGDVRRLSFISFADVVHAEHELGDNRRDSANIGGLAAHSNLVAPRSPSPIRSPVSSQAMGTSPSTSIAPSIKGQEVSPTRNQRGTGSPLPGSPSPVAVGELNIETMSQALRRTGSGDLSGFRSPAASTAGIDDSALERPPR